MSYEKYGGLFLNPLEAERIAFPLIHELGVDMRMGENPDEYIAQIKKIDPRYVNTKGEERNISRWDVTNKAHLMTSGMLVLAVFHTAENLGLLDESYPFDDFAEDADAILVTGGLFSAYEKRLKFATDGPDVPLFIVGGGRELKKPDFDAMVSSGLGESSLKTEADMAELFASDSRQKGIKAVAFTPRTKKPDNLDTLYEFSLLHPEIEKLAVVTTELYVPFTSYDIGAVESMLNGTLKARAYAGKSDPEAVKRRTVDTYRSEIAKTLVSGARMYRELIRRS